IVLVLIAAYTGYRRGALLQLFTYVGLLAGLVIGAILAPKFARLAHDQFLQSVIALGSFFAIAGIGDAIGWLVGSRVWRATRGSRLGLLDSAGGALMGMVVGLLTGWVIWFSRVTGPFPTVARRG